ncbi:hypothetical protein BN1723_010999, partial [Verticillium longisporum]
MADQNKFSSKLRGACILIIGGSAGVGYAVAEASIEQDAAAIIISSSNAKKAEKSVASLQSSYASKASRISGIVCDLANEEALERNIANLLNAAINGDTDRIHHGAYTAGDSPVPRALADVDLTYIKSMFLIRAFALLLFTKHARKHLAPGAGSSFTLTSGTASVRPIAGFPVLAAVTASVQGLAAALAVDFAPARVNVVSLGAVNTETLWSYLADRNPEERAKLESIMNASTLTRSIGEPADVAEAYIYCMRDNNVTGASIDSTSGHILSKSRETRQAQGLDVNTMFAEGDRASEQGPWVFSLSKTHIIPLFWCSVF